MKITVDTKRDGGAIRIDGQRVGYIEAYTRGPCFIRFATTEIGDGPMGYGNTEAVARIKFGGFSEAKKYAKRMLKLSGGDYRTMASRGADGTTWGETLIASFA